MAVNIMIQGTMSNAGKSLITAGLCRVFMQDGYRVAPFKSQNMALNSYITNEGLEMGRAQVVQAEACGKEPCVLMNPVLLKPTTDVGSQVIVNGKSIGNMPAAEYFRYKKKLIPDIMEAYSRLAEENDIIVIEGAGSPAEINLKSDDIVNMGLAKMLDAPVLLVGDIDRGGVFAQLYGTVMLLEEEEKERIKGLIINKFRGDKAILEPGLKMIEDLCKKSVMGVVPYADVDIDDEDSLTERFEKRYDDCSADNGAIDMKIKICVIRLPRISNFSDMMILEASGGTELIYADRPVDLINADLIIIPGSKSTISDLEWMKKNGIANKIISASRNGVPVIGVCGGYQMLGEMINDMEGVESETNYFSDTDNCDQSAKGVSVPGLCLLPVVTDFQREKQTVQVSGKIPSVQGLFSPLSGICTDGYEIHMGRTYLLKKSAESFNLGDEGVWTESSQTEDEENESLFTICGNVFGTYMHGIFDNKEFSEKLIGIIAEKKGISLGNCEVPDLKAYKERQYNRLAEIIRENCDMGEIYRIMGFSETDAS